MDIKTVTYNKEEGTLPAHFIVTHPDGTTTGVPIESTNRHFQELKAWYEAQDKKPFKFDFGAVEKSA